MVSGALPDVYEQPLTVPAGCRIVRMLKLEKSAHYKNGRAQGHHGQFQILLPGDQQH